MGKVIAVVWLLALAACASAGTKFEWDNARRVTVGMSEAELIALLGKPNAVATHANGTQTWTWVHVSSSVLTGAASQKVYFPLKDGKVTAVPNLSTFQ